MFLVIVDVQQSVEWKVSEQLTVIKNSVIAAEKGRKKSGPMIYERAVIRGKTVYRWKYIWDRIYDGDGIFAWMPYPESPEEEVENG